MKPHRGKLVEAERAVYKDGYIYFGKFEGHPRFHGRRGHTSLVVKEVCNGNTSEVETLNSRYTIVLKEPSVQRLDIL